VTCAVIDRRDYSVTEETMVSCLRGFVVAFLDAIAM